MLRVGDCRTFVGLKGTCLTAFVAVIGLGLFAPTIARAAPVQSFSYSPTSPFTGELITFTSPYDNPQDWDLNGDGTCDDASGTTAQHSFEAAGTYTVKLCVGGPNPANFTRTVTVQNRPPIADFSYAPAAPFAGDTIVFTSKATDADGPIVGVGWDLDNDGAFDDGSGGSVSTVFPAPGAYTVRLQVLDRDGATAVASATVVVAKRPPKVFVFSPTVQMIATVGRTATRVRTLSVNAPDGSRVSVSCFGRGCPFRRLTRSAGVRSPSAHLRAHAARRIRIQRLRRRLLRPGAIVKVRITQADTIGKFTRFRIRRGKVPRRTDRCLTPGSTRPVQCPPA